MNTEAIAVTLRVTSALEDMGVPYAIAGSLASSLRGVPRASVDGDLVADLREGHVDALVARLSPDFYVDADAARAAVRARGSFNLVHFDTAFKIDVLVCGTRPFDRSEMERRREETVREDPPARAWVMTAEDVILAKLDWFRKGGEQSDRQWRDVLGVLRVQDDAIDVDYLRRWAAALAVDDLLDRALVDARGG